jgi:tryptophan synthase beta subunit
VHGIIPALESSHALAWGFRRAAELPADKVVLINLSGRGDKDVWQAARAMGVDIKL